jgi:hypothetical protein
MIVLYSGTGSGGFELFSAYSDAATIQRLKANATALLEARGKRRAAALLSQFSFSLWEGSNDWNDAFQVLHATLRLDDYETARRQAAVSEDRAAYAAIAEVLSEIGPYVRFIAVSLDTTKQVRNSQGLTERQIKKLAYKFIGVREGYLGDFSYQKHADFYTDLDLDINPYNYDGTTRERFMQIVSESAPHVQAAILDGILERFAVGSDPIRTQQLADEIRNWAVGLRSGPAVEHPTPKNAPETVRRALADAEHLLQKNGATSAVDRVHTALHGYQLGLCAEAGITPEVADPNLTQVFKCLRKQHPALQASGHRAQDIESILNAMNTILSAMNPIRNRASVAHPNEILLDEAEARLAINTGRTIFHYLDAKVEAWRTQRTTMLASPALPDDDVPF